MANCGVELTGGLTIVLTHLHYDHAGNVDQFPNATVVTSQQEYEFWSGHGLATRPV
jgi:glyoxylase-like metal-dependent hydrolase (beta-lactamase superfamily II)